MSQRVVVEYGTVTTGTTAGRSTVVEEARVDVTTASRPATAAARHRYYSV